MINWMLVCWGWWCDWSFARLIAPVITTTSIILSFNKHQLTRCTWKMAAKTDRESGQSTVLQPSNNSQHHTAASLHCSWSTYLMTSILTRKLREPQMLCTLCERTSDVCNNKHSVHLHSVKVTDVSEEHCTLIRVPHRPPREPLWIADVRFIHAGCPSCHSTNSVRSLK